MGELAKSQYVYLLCDGGLLRVNVSGLDQTCKHELKLECVFYDQSYDLPVEMGLFSFDYCVYMIGGRIASKSRSGHGLAVYVFDPSRFKEFPVKDPECIDIEGYLCYEFKAMVAPRVIRTKRKIYFLSESNTLFNGCYGEKSISSFQSLDLNSFFFANLACPPIDDSAVSHSVCGHFVLCDYVYLFTVEFRRKHGPLGDFRLANCVRAFSFDTRSLEWQDKSSLVRRFKEKKIPLPCIHRGDIGLSDEFSDNTRVLVAVNRGMPIAYRVCLRARGSLRPKSYRVLDEIYIAGDGDTRLLDIGGGRFCMVDYSLDQTILICVFKIDFALEHEIQISAINEGRSISPAKPSSEILSSKKFKVQDIPFSLSGLTDVCLVAAPASQSYLPSAPGNEKQRATVEGFGREEHEVTAPLDLETGKPNSMHCDVGKKKSHFKGRKRDRQDTERKGDTAKGLPQKGQRAS